MTKEQIYREQMQALGIYDPIFEPELKMLVRLERELTRAQKAWSATAVPAGSAPSFMDPHYTVIQKLRAEIRQHRETLGRMAMSLWKISRSAGAEAPAQKDLITAKLDAIAAKVAGYAAEDGVAFIGDKGPVVWEPSDPYAELMEELNVLPPEDLL